MGKVIEFPSQFKGHSLDRSAVRVAALEKRLGVLEQQLANYQEDINFISSCRDETEYELGELLDELTQIKGFKEELCE